MSSEVPLGGDATAAESDTSAPKPKPAAGPTRGVHDMTQGSVRGHLLRMMAFMLVGMTLQTLYSLVDIYWVGNLGKQAVAAVSMSTNLMFIALGATQALSVGCVALVSRAAGQKDHPEVQRLFNQAQCLATCTGLLFLCISLPMRTVYTSQLAGDHETERLANEFLLAFIPSLALQFSMVGLGSALRGIGDMKPGLVAQTASVLLNMALAPVLIFGWGFGKPLGVFGAAVSTFVATLAAVIGLAVYLTRGTTFLRLDFSQWAPDFGTWRRMLAIGLPAGAEFILLAIVVGSSYFFTRNFGPHLQAGFGIGSRVMQAGFMPAVTISFSVAAVAGQNFGAKAFDRVRATMTEATKLVLLFMVSFAILCQFAPEPMVRIFSDADEVVAAGSDYLRTLSIAFIANGVIFVSAGMFQGLGNTWPSLAASGLRCLLFVGAVSLASHQAGFSAHRIWQISVGSVVLQLIAQQLLLRREMRLKAPKSDDRSNPNSGDPRAHEAA